MIIYRFKITYAYVYKTKEHKAQKDEQKYGAITLSYSFWAEKDCSWPK